mmetsp:Transcript_24584/g.29003  ORF Transcript_24584/g.29003 Transcript_24584/m.29003 type:complete len:213 (-) Transcript_24584:152-790(-)
MTMRTLYTISIICVILMQSSLGFMVPQGTMAPLVRVWKTERHALEQERVSNWELDTKPFTTTKSGLKYVDMVVGDGDSPSDGDFIAVHYIGWYDKFVSDDGDDSKKTSAGVNFDNSLARDPEPLKFQYGKAPIIKGWTEALETMKAGGKRELIVPPSLGYGDKEVKSSGQPSIPANSHLRFIIDLVEVDNSILTKIRTMIPKPSTFLDKPLF